jgi:hypothetical protein
MIQNKTDKYQTDLCNLILDQRRSSQFVDTKIITADGFVWAHKAILSFCQPFWRQILQNFTVSQVKLNFLRTTVFVPIQNDN